MRFNEEMFRDGSLRWSGPSGMLGVIWEMGLDGPTQIDHVLGAPGGVQHGEEAHPLVVIDHALVPHIHLHVDPRGAAGLQRHHRTRQQPFGHAVVLHTGRDEVQANQ